VETASGTVNIAPLVLIDLDTDAGVRGSTYLFTYTPAALGPTADLIRNLASLVVGQPLAPLLLFDTLTKRVRLLGAEGLVCMAIAGLDMAAWDALARFHQVSLARLLGATEGRLAAYASLRSMRPDALRREVEDLAPQHFTAFKFKVGLADIAADVAAIEAVRGAAPKGSRLMVDYNQSLDQPEAKRRLAVLDGLDLTWVEEPLPMGDVTGQAHLRAGARTPLQGGENWWGPEDMARSIAAGASDHAMPDVMKIGGVTGWMRAAALAHAAGLPVSSHIFPEVSAHLMRATPTAFLLEYLDLAGPILAEPLRIEDGQAVMSEAPGSGVVWNEKAIERFTD
jgi:mandelate racemase